VDRRCVYLACLVWLGWTVDKGLHWAMAAVTFVLFGVFGMILYGAIATAFTEFNSKQTSSCLAIENFVRNILSFIAAVVT
jgi:Mg2+/Co2+ transporter CorB